MWKSEVSHSLIWAVAHSLIWAVRHSLIGRSYALINLGGRSYTLINLGGKTLTQSAQTKECGIRPNERVYHYPSHSLTWAGDAGHSLIGAGLIEPRPSPTTTPQDSTFATSKFKCLDPPGCAGHSIAVSTTKQ